MWTFPQYRYFMKVSFGHIKSSFYNPAVIFLPESRNVSAQCLKILKKVISPKKNFSSKSYYGYIESNFESPAQSIRLEAEIFTIIVRN